MLTKLQREGHAGLIQSVCRHLMRPLSHATSSCSSHSLSGRAYPWRTFIMRMRREFSWEGGERTSPSNTSFQRKIVTSMSCDRIHSYWWHCWRPYRQMGWPSPLCLCCQVGRSPKQICRFQTSAGKSTCFSRAHDST